MTRILLINACLKPRTAIPRETCGDCSSEACTSFGGEARIPFRDLRETFRSGFAPDPPATTADPGRPSAARRSSSDTFDRFSLTDWDGIIQGTALPPGSAPSSIAGTTPDAPNGLAPILRVHFRSSVFAGSRYSSSAGDLHGALPAEQHSGRARLAAAEPRASTGSGWNECGALDDPADLDNFDPDAATEAKAPGPVRLSSDTSSDSGRIMSRREEAGARGAWSPRGLSRKVSAKLNLLLARRKGSADAAAAGPSFSSSTAGLTVRSWLPRTCVKLCLWD